MLQLTNSTVLQTLNETVFESRQGLPNRYTGVIPKPVSENTHNVAREILESLESTPESIWFTESGEICMSFITGIGVTASVTIFAED
jgi:hypothetical protein